MSAIASTLLDFILNLLRDPDTARAFNADPQGTLDAHGLGDITSVDLDDTSRYALRDRFWDHIDKVKLT